MNTKQNSASKPLLHKKNKVEKQTSSHKPATKRNARQAIDQVSTTTDLSKSLNRQQISSTPSQYSTSVKRYILPKTSQVTSTQQSIPDYRQSQSPQELARSNLFTSPTQQKREEEHENIIQKQEKPHEILQENHLVRGSLQREFLGSTMLIRQQDQKKKLREILDQQIEEKKRRQEREKQIEKERCLQEEERLRKEIEQEKQQEQMQKIKQQQLYLQQMKEQQVLPNKVGRNKTLSTQNEDEKTKCIDEIQKKTKTLEPKDLLQKTCNLEKEQSQTQNPNILIILRKENEDLKELNNKKDSIIKQLIKRTDQKSNQGSNVPQLDEVQKVIPNTRLNSSQSTQFLLQRNAVSPLSGKCIPIPRTSQEAKQIQIIQRLPKITTPQPQLNHPKQLRSFEEDRCMIPFNKNSFILDPLIRKNNLIDREDENWSFGKIEIIPPHHVKRKTDGQEGQYINSDAESYAQTAISSGNKTQVRLKVQKQPLLNFTPNIESPHELPQSSNFLKFDQNGTNPGFTFSNSQADHLFSSVKSSAKTLKDKLPKEFQIVPLKRKFFV